MYNEYHDWGDVFSIDFDIRVNVLPSKSDEMLNVLRFTANDQDNDNHGDSLPSVMVSHESSLLFFTSLNDDPKYLTKFDFDIETVHHITIQQLKKDSRYWYEIVIDGESIVKKENTNINSYPSVILYTR